MGASSCAVGDLRADASLDLDGRLSRPKSRRPDSPEVELLSRFASSELPRARVQVIEAEHPVIGDLCARELRQPVGCVHRPAARPPRLSELQASLDGAPGGSCMSSATSTLPSRTWGPLVTVAACEARAWTYQGVSSGRRARSSDTVPGVGDLFARPSWEDSLSASWRESKRPRIDRDRRATRASCVRRGYLGAHATAGRSGG